MRVRIVLADDHALVRAGLRKLLESMPDIEVVGEADDGQAVLRLVEQLHPNLVLMDVSMPGLNGLDTALRLSQTHPQTRVLILSMHQSEDYVRQALRNGAAGYILKDAAPVELDLALKAILRGETYLSPAVSRGVVSDYVQRLRTEETPGAVLTPRQREILQLIGEGSTTKDVARRLNISVKTVETHRTQLMKQLDLHDLAGLVRYAIRVGLVSSEK